MTEAADNEHVPFDISTHVIQQGKFLIINNETFCKDWPDRLGTNNDAEKLKTTFKKFGFKSEILSNLKKDQMLKAIIEIACEDHSQYDCLAIAILTHGGQEEGKDILFGTDGESIKLNELMKPLKDSRCKLAGIPKLIFLQACRGTKVDSGLAHYVQYDVPDAMDDGDATDQERKERKTSQKKLKIRIPEESDFLYHYSTASGYFAWRPALGAVFIQRLCEVLDRNVNGTTDLLTLLTCVNRKVAEEYESNCKNQAMSGKKQMPVIQSQLRKCIILKRQAIK